MVHGMSLNIGNIVYEVSLKNILINFFCKNSGIGCSLVFIKLVVKPGYNQSNTFCGRC